MYSWVLQQKGSSQATLFLVFGFVYTQKSVFNFPIVAGDTQPPYTLFWGMP